MMETQLDDRHYIPGNTLYRLAFNAAVLAGTRKYFLAVVTVKVSHDWEDEHFENDYKGSSMRNGCATCQGCCYHFLPKVSEIHLLICHRSSPTHAADAHFLRWRCWYMRCCCT